VLGRAGAMVQVQLLSALGAAAPPGPHLPAAPRAGGAQGMQHAAAGVRSGLAARRHRVLLPTGQFFGGDSTAFFFDVRVGHSGPL
jgi:hypothetical protein